MKNDGEKFTEDELALQFVELHPTHRWVERWHKWMIWDGAVWSDDSTLAVYDAVRNFLRSVSWAARNSDELRRAKVVAAVETLARSDRRCAATTDQWDNDQWILNTPGGIVDLRTGKVSEHRPGAHCTMIAGTKAADTARCPRWVSFLKDVTQGDQALIAFLQRLLGYCLTGQTIEHALFFFYGVGGNGKTTLLDTITRILGNYATSAPMEVFVASNSDRHPTELAMLRGARLVTAVETEEGRRWAESRIKALTGGDAITARFMRQDYFTFRPAFKLLVIGNHKPRLLAVDDAIRRRLHLVPFEAKFAGDRIVQDMPTKLREEWPGILRWMIDGCLKWQAEGLAPPEKVTAATAHYFANQDTLAEWRVERCETGPGFWETPTRLFNSWRAYAKDAEFPVGTRSSFNDRMETAGFCQVRDYGKGRHWQAIRIKPEHEPVTRDWTDTGS